MSQRYADRDKAKVRESKRRARARAKQGFGPWEGDASLRTLRYTHDEILEALRAWAAQNGRAPMAREWELSDPANPRRPTRQTVRAHFRTWRAAVEAAGLEPYDSPTSRRVELGRNRRMVTGRTFTDRDAGTVKHFGA